MRIESVDFFYLAMPEITDDVDGSQDALLVRVRSGQWEGWGECEAAPLPCIAAYCCPPSHGVCKPVKTAVEGATLEGPDDIRRINAEARRLGLDLLQTDHTLSGIDVALWDLLGKVREEPVYRLLGDRKAFPKMPYASVLLGDTPEETYAKARGIRAQGFRAAKFGWGPLGKSTLEADVAQVRAAREGLGDEGILLLDVGVVWQDDPLPARRRAEAFREFHLTWLEEPFRSEALDAYRALAEAHPELALAAGEGANNLFMARDLVKRGGIRYLQIDAGRIGGITTAYEARLLAEAEGITYVNHTFTSHLALSASLQPFVGVERFALAEYPTELRPLARDLTQEQILPDANGLINVPEAPGLGMTPNLDALQKYLVPVRIAVGGQELHRTPIFDFRFSISD
jgi:L-alanine-DL-glutamate epimerase-like enolase superfamily enzyme